MAYQFVYFIFIYTFIRLGGNEEWWREATLTRRQHELCFLQLLQKPFVSFLHFLLKKPSKDQEYLFIFFKRICITIQLELKC